MVSVMEMRVKFREYTLYVTNQIAINDQGPLLLIRFNLNPVMNK